jgi:hypothetical protein
LIRLSQPLQKNDGIVLYNSTIASFNVPFTNPVTLSSHKLENIWCSRLLPKNIKIRLYKTIILPVVLYGCETWSLTVKDERKLRVFENRALRRIFGPKRDEMTGDWRKLHNEELHNL